MKTILKEIKVYKFGECPKIDEKIKERWHNDSFYGSWILDDHLETLKSFAKKLHLKLDYSLSLVPDRGEFIKFIGELDDCILSELIANKENCPLTGICYDHDFLENVEKMGLTEACHEFIHSIHKEYKSIFEDEYLKEYCDVNEYEFLEDGSFYVG